MKRIIFILFILLIGLYGSKSFAAEENLSINLSDSIKIQKQIGDIGYKLLNANKIDVRMIFLYKEKSDKKLKIDSGLTDRQVLIYNEIISLTSDENEIAAYIAREICKCAESYSGSVKGYVSSVQIKCAPKKYELFFDKRAIDFMVMAGYNPIGFITFIHKAFPQKHFDKISHTNLTSKRLANIYEYIYTKYPYYLANNEYINNDVYQNFLLTSIENRKKLANKIKSGSKKAIKYE